jgi:penicillin-insensitive murein endopeptidase
VGEYANGSLLNAEDLPLESAAHLKIFRPRKRGFGTRTLLRTLIEGIEIFHSEFPVGDRVQIGDLSAWSGGDLSPMHASHQNGLDVDVAYLRVNHLERDPNVWGERGFEEVFVKNKELTKNFDLRRNWFLLRALVERGNVNRVFVDPEIKRAFCNQVKKIDPAIDTSLRDEVLRRLRPLAEHDDHFHLRVNCPKSSPKCVTQEAPPAGSGCATIDEESASDRHELETY